MINPQQNKYLETSIQTATPSQLLIMLHDGAIRNCKNAIEAIKQSNHEATNRYLGKVQDIISEFVITIDQNAAVSESLLQLYEYFNYRLTEANTKKETEPVEEVMQYIMDLKQTWVEAAKTAIAGGTRAGN